MTTIDRVSQLRAALVAVGDALASADLERLLAADPALAAALDGLTGVSPDGPPAELRHLVDGTRAALLRCRRLGAGLVDFAQLSLDPCGERVYSRSGASPIGARAALLETRG